MKTYFRSCLCVSLLLSGAAYGAYSSDASDKRARQGAFSTITQHPHSDLLEHQNHYHNYVYGESDCFNVKFNFAYQFDQTFNEEENLTRALFGDAARSTSGAGGSAVSDVSDVESRAIAIQGSQFKRNNQNQAKANALLAEQFGLAPDTNTTVHFDPQIQNHLFNFQMYMNLGELLEGMYAQVDLPLVHTEWKLREDVGDDNQRANINSNVGSREFVAGCIDAVSVDNVKPISNIENALGGQGVGDKQQLNWDRIIFNEKDDTKLANLSFSLGYNFWECPDYHFGAYFYVAAPTATEIGIDQDNKNELFAPVIGSDHWEIGGGLQGHFELYNWDDMHTLTVYMQGYAATALDEETTRTFDLKNQGQLSRYMLLKEFDNNNHYTGTLMPAANYTTRTVETEIDIKGEGQIEFMYSNGCGLDMSLGYNIWGQDNEELDHKALPSNQMDNRNFGVKGCTPVEALGFDRAAAAGPAVAGNPNLQGISVQSTQSNATAFSCPDLQQAGNTGALQARKYQPVDNATNNFVGGDNANATDPCLDQKKPQANQNVSELTLVREASGPQFISKDDIDVQSGLTPSMVAHKIFGRVNYTFEDVDFTPYVGLGASVEFADEVGHATTPERWAIFFNGGISF